jgi:hypothetical protein
VRLGAYVEAYRTLPVLAAGADVGDWLAELVGRAAAGGQAAGEEPADLWEALAGRLRAEAPALAAPGAPERRFPVVPRLQRRRRLQGPR